MDITDMTLKFCVGYQIASSQKSRTHYNPVPSAACTPPNSAMVLCVIILLFVVKLREARGKDAARTASRTVRAAEPDYDSKGLIKMLSQYTAIHRKKTLQFPYFCSELSRKLPCCGLV